MVQSLKLGGAPNEGSEAGIRRVNRLPIIIVIVLVIAFLGVVFYGLTTRGLLVRQNTGPGDSSGNPASTFADQLKRGVGDAIIGEPQQTKTLQPTPVETNEEKSAANRFTPQPEHREEARPAQELESEQLWRARLKREQDEQYLRERQRQRMARLQAYDAPITVDHGKFEGRGGNTSIPSNTTTTAIRRQRAVGHRTSMPPRCAPVSAAPTSIPTASAGRKSSSTPISRS